SLPDHGSPVMAAAWSRDGKFIATGARNGVTRLFDAKTRKELHVLRGHKDSSRAAAFSLDSRFLRTGSTDGKVKIWRVADGKEVASLDGPEKGINSVDWSRDGKHIAATSKPQSKEEPGEVRLWSVKEEGATLTFKQRAVLKGHTAHVLGCAFSPD